MPEKREPLPPALTPQAKPVSISARVIAGILEKRSPHDRVTHDTGFHRERITILNSTSDGKYIFTGGAEGTVRMWDLRSGKSLRSFPCRRSALSRILVTPNNDIMITAEPFGQKKVWDLKTGNCLKDLSRLDGKAWCCDDNYVYCYEKFHLQDLIDRKAPERKGSEVTVYEIMSGGTVHRLRIDNAHMTSLDVSPDSSKIAVLCDDWTLTVWDLVSGARLFRYATAVAALRPSHVIGFTADSAGIALESGNDIVVLDMSGKESFRFATQRTEYGRSHVLRGSRLFEETRDLSSFSSTIRVIDIGSGSVSNAYGFPAMIDLDSITRDGSCCLGFRKDGIDILDLAGHRVVRSITLDEPKLWPASTLYTIVPEGFVISNDESIMRFVGPSIDKPVEIPGNEKIRDVLATPDGSGLIVMTGSEVQHWDLKAGYIVRKFSIRHLVPHDELTPGSSSMALTPDGKYIVLPSKNGAVLRMLSTGQKVRDLLFGADMNGLQGTRPAGLNLFVTPDGKRLLVVSGPEGFIGSYDLDTGKRTPGFTFDSAGKFSAFCASGNALFTSEGELWSRHDAVTGKLLDTESQGASISHMAFIDSLETLAVTTWRSLHFWDCPTGGKPARHPDEKTIMGMSAHTRSGEWLCPVPGGKYLLVHVDDCVALWDLESRRFRWSDEFRRKNDVKKVFTFADGKRFAAIDTTGTLEIRGIEKGEVLASLSILPDGFIWETPPDAHAPSGWLWTDREDLATVVSHSKGDRATSVFRSGDSEHTSYMKIYNSTRMVMARIAGKASYRRQVGLYAAAMDEAKEAIASGNEAPVPITAGEKGDKT